MYPNIIPTFKTPFPGFGYRLKHMHKHTQEQRQVHHDIITRFPRRIATKLGGAHVLHAGENLHLATYRAGLSWPNLASCL